MATRPSTKLTNSLCGQRKLAPSTNNEKSIPSEIRGPERILLPADEFECRQIYEKLEQLQPNGVCVNLDTLRRALYPPASISKDKNDQILLLRTSSRERTIEMPRIRSSAVSKQTRINRMNLAQVIHQVNKHAAINYSYYTRTK